MTKREWMVAGVAFVLGAVALQAGSRFLTWLQVDSCLDDGGKWDYQFRTCIGARSESEQAPQ